MSINRRIRIILYIAAAIPAAAALVSGATASILGLSWVYATVIASTCFVIAGIATIEVCFRKVAKLGDEVFSRLTAFVEAIASGDPRRALGTPSIDGLGTLAKALNNMADRLTEIHMEMDKNVKDATAELQAKVAEVNDSNKAVLNLLEDIDKEKGRAEELVKVRTRELSEERARLISSINSLSFGFVIADMEHRILLKNRAITDLLGAADKADLSVEDLTRLLSEKINVLAEVNKCLAGTGVCEIKEIFYGTRILRGIVAPVEGKSGRIGYVFLLEDITEVKVMERSRDEFFAVASHELRTPLTAIKGNSDMITDLYGDKIVDTEMRDMLSDINLSAVRLIDIVNDFLEVSRLEQGRIEIHSERFEISEVINKVVRDMQAMVVKSGLVLETQSLSDGEQIYADKNRVEQIIVNLVGNALKFTKEGKISISAEKAKLDGADALKIIVTDTGIGISDKNQSRLFRKFQQAGEDMIARDITQGTGLGLYICQLLVARMGGSIQLEHSELGKGSSFSFTIPTSPLPVRAA